MQFLHDNIFSSCISKVAIFVRRQPLGNISSLWLLISIQAMDPNTNKIYLAIGATATILAGALGYYILVLKKSKNKVSIYIIWLKNNSFPTLIFWRKSWLAVFFSPSKRSANQHFKSKFQYVVKRNLFYTRMHEKTRTFSTQCRKTRAKSLIFTYIMCKTNFILYNSEILTWKVDLLIFFTRFTHERKPQNNFSRQCKK